MSSSETTHGKHEYCNSYDEEKKSKLFTSTIQRLCPPGWVLAASTVQAHRAHRTTCVEKQCRLSREPRQTTIGEAKTAPPSLSSASSSLLASYKNPTFGKIQLSYVIHRAKGRRKKSSTVPDDSSFIEAALQSRHRIK